MKFRPTSPPLRAFALFETLLALAIFVVAGTALIGALQKIHLTLSQGRDEVRAARNLSSFVAENFESGLNLEVGSGETEPTADGMVIKWEMTEPNDLFNVEGEKLNGLLHLKAVARWNEDQTLALERLFLPSLHDLSQRGRRVPGLNRRPSSSSQPPPQ